MHTSYLSLAVFALGAAAAPSFPKPNGDPFAGSFPFFPTGSSSASDEDSGLSNPVPAYMAAMEAVQSAQNGAYNTPQPTQAAVAKPQQAPQQESGPFHPKHKNQPAPAPMADAIPTGSTPPLPSAPEEPAVKSTHKVKPVVPSSVIAEAIADAMSSMAPNDPVTVTPVTPTPTSNILLEATSAVMSTFVSMNSPAPTHRPMHSMGIHEGHVSSSMYDATPSSSATPSPSASMGPASSSGPLGAVSGLTGSLPILGPLIASLGLRR